MYVCISVNLQSDGRSVCHVFNAFWHGLCGQSAQIGQHPVKLIQGGGGCPLRCIYIYIYNGKSSGTQVTWWIKWYANRLVNQVLHIVTNQMVNQVVQKLNGEWSGTRTKWSIKWYTNRLVNQVVCESDGKWCGTQIMQIKTSIKWYTNQVVDQVVCKSKSKSTDKCYAIRLVHQEVCK